MKGQNQLLSRHYKCRKPSPLPTHDKEGPLIGLSTQFEAKQSFYGPIYQALASPKKLGPGAPEGLGPYTLY